jgi:hypothetical protein
MTLAEERAAAIADMEEARRIHMPIMPGRGLRSLRLAVMTHGDD